MRKKVVMSIASLLLCIPLHAGAQSDFSDLNPPLDERMKEAIAQAKECKNPAVAEEKFDQRFRYGCFCGKNYPDIKDPSLKPPQYLTYSERKALIARYYAIKPYDTIDAACQQHDICYIYNGEDNQACNDAFYRRMQEIYNAYESTDAGQKPGTRAWRCKILASDLSAIFRIIFAAGEDISASRFSIFAMITPFSIATKIVQKSALSVSERSGYPLPFERCNIETNSTTKAEPQSP